MFAMILEKLLTKYIGKYLKDFQKNTMDVGLFNGEVLIQNVGLNNTLFQQFNIPATLKFSNIQKILIQVPWTKLDEKPTLVSIIGIDVLLDLQTKNYSTKMIAKFQEIIFRIKQKLKKFDEEIDKQKQKKQKENSIDPKNIGQKFLVRMFDNVEVNIKNIHVRFQDNSSFGNHHFSFGFFIEQINIFTANANGVKQFYIRDFKLKQNNKPLFKKLKISQINVYWNQNEIIFIKDAIQENQSKNYIVQCMRTPFPSYFKEKQKFVEQEKKISIPVIPTTSTSINSNETTNVSYTDLNSQMSPKKNKKQDKNIFADLFKIKPKKQEKKEDKKQQKKDTKKEEIKKEEKKQIKKEQIKKEQKKQQKKQIKKEEKQQPKVEIIIPIELFTFNIICSIKMYADIEQSDYKDKDSPLFKIKANFDLIKINFNQIFFGQLLYILQYIVKYFQNLFYFENKSQINNFNSEGIHKKFFNNMIQNIIKKNPKIQKLDEVPSDIYRSFQQKNTFHMILQKYSIKKLEQFTDIYIQGEKIKRQIQKAKKNLKSNNKGKSDLQKFMQSMKNKNQIQDQFIIDSENRVMFQLKVKIKEVSISISYLKDRAIADFIRIVLPQIVIEAKYISDLEFDFILKVEDLLLTYQQGEKIYSMDKNKLQEGQNFVNFILRRRNRNFDVVSQFQKKIIVIEQYLISFGLRFIQEVRITPFFLNFFIQLSDITSTIFQTQLSALLTNIKHFTTEIRFYLPTIQLKLKQISVVFDLGTLMINIPNYNTKSLPIQLSKLQSSIFYNNTEHKFLNDINFTLKFQRNEKTDSNVDSLRIQSDKITINIPSTQLIDLIGNQIIAIITAIGKNQTNYVIRHNQNLQTIVFLNNIEEQLNLSIKGQLVQLKLKDKDNTLKNIFKTSLFQMRVYPLIQNGQYYLVFVKNKKVDYIKFLNEKLMYLYLQKINKLIETYCTIEQLKLYWKQTSVYESEIVGKKVQCNKKNIFDFLLYCQSKQPIQQLFQMNVLCRDIDIAFRSISLNMKILKLNYKLYNQMQELIMSINKLQMKFNNIEFMNIYAENHNQDCLKFKLETIVSENIEIETQTMEFFLNNELLQLIVQDMKYVLDLKSLLFINDSVNSISNGQLISRKKNLYFNFLETSLHIKLRKMFFNLFGEPIVVNEIMMDLETWSDSIQFDIKTDKIEVLYSLSLGSSKVNATFFKVCNNKDHISLMLDTIIVSINPEICEKYLIILARHHIKLLQNIQKFTKVISHIQSIVKQEKDAINIIQLQCRIQNLQIQLGANQNNLILIKLDEILALLQAKKKQSIKCTLSLMKINIIKFQNNWINNQILQFEIIKPYSIILKSNIAMKNNQILIFQINLAITKLDIQVNFQLFQFLFNGFDKYLALIGNNIWLIYFAKKSIESIVTQQKAHDNYISLERQNCQIILNTQIQNIIVSFFNKNLAPFIKLSICPQNPIFKQHKQKQQIIINIDLMIDHFAQKLKIYQPLLEKSLITCGIQYYWKKELINLDVAIKSIKVNVSFQLANDLVTFLEMIRSFLEKQKNSVLEIKYYIQKIKQAQFIPELVVSYEKQKVFSAFNLQSFYNMKSSDNLKQQKKKHNKNFIKVINSVGVDVCCKVYFTSNLDNEQLEQLHLIKNNDSSVYPINIDTEYKQNYEIVERLKIITIEFKLLNFGLIQKRFSLVNILNQKLILQEPGEQEKVQLRLNSIVQEDLYVINLTTPYKLCNQTELNYKILIYNEGIQYTYLLQSKSELYLPYFIKNVFFVSIENDKQKKKIIFDKKNYIEEIFLTKQNERIYILLSYNIGDSVNSIHFSYSILIHNHFPLYLGLFNHQTEILLQPNNITKSNKISMKNDFKFSIKITCHESKEKSINFRLKDLLEEREISYKLHEPDNQSQIKIYFLYTPNQKQKILHIYPRLSFVNNSNQRIKLFRQFYGNIYPIKKMVKENTSSYQKFNLNLKESEIKVKYNPLKDCFILDEERYLYVSHSIHRKDFSKQIIAYESDFKKSFSIQNQGFTYHYYLEYSEIKLNEKISTYKTIMYPKFYFINRTQFNLNIYKIIKVLPKQLVILPFDKQNQLIMEIETKQSVYLQANRLKLTDDNKEIRYAKKFNLGFINAKDKNSENVFYNENQILKFELELIFHNSMGYYILAQKEEHIMIKNSLKSNWIKLKQKTEFVCIHYKILQRESKEYFALFCDEICVEIYTKDDKLLIYETIDLSQRVSDTFQIQNQDKSIILREYFENSNRIIQFYSDENESIINENEPQKKLQASFKLNCNEIVASAVFYDFNDCRREILNIQIHNINLINLFYNKLIMIELKVFDLSIICNQLHSTRKILSKRKSPQSDNLINVFCQSYQQQHLLQNFKIKLAPLSVFISDEFVELILKNMNKIIYLIEPEHIIKNQKNFHEFYELYQKKKLIYKDKEKRVIKLKNFEISEIIIEITLKKTFYKGNKEFLTSFGISFVDLEKAKLQLSKLTIYESQQPEEAFIIDISSAYLKQSLSLLIGVLGGLNIIGNPKQFYMEVQTGLGQYQSGIFRGTKGFIMGVTAGTANALSKIMGSLGNGIGSLSLDDDYLQQRQKIKDKEINSLSDGLSSSASSIFKGVESGITGLFKQPIQGHKKDGFFGAITGSIKGLTGLITKPLTGLIDAASGTAQGIKMVSKVGKTQKDEQLWYKPLYFERNIIRNSDQVDQTCYMFMKKFFPQELEKIHLVKFFMLENQDGGTLVEILVISVKQVMQININNKTIIQKISNSDMTATAKFSQGVVLYYQPEDQQFQVIFRLKRNAQMKQILYLTLQKLIQTFNKLE